MPRWIKNWLTRRWMAKREREVAARTTVLACPHYPKPSPEIVKDWDALRAQISGALSLVDAKQ